MSNGSARDSATRDDATRDSAAPDSAAEALPRRSARGTGRIPTRYGPGNPVSDRLKRHQFRVRPGAPNLPIPEPQQGTPSEKPLTAYAVRPGTPEDTASTAPQQPTAGRGRGRRGFWLGTALVALIGLVGASVALASSHSVKHSAGAARPTGSTAPAQPLPPITEPATAAPSPSAAAPTAATPDPVTLISLAGTDTAPLSTVTLFPGKSVTVHGHSYTQALTTASGCAAAATPPLAAVLAKNGCLQVFRATYAAGTTAVTVGVAVFGTAAQAAAVKQQATGNLAPLAGAAVPAFCHAVPCRLSVNAFGRYAYFTVAGYTTGKPVPTNDTSALAAGSDIGAMAFQNLATRARNEAATAAP
ncbi:hypothetical protein [Streptacidiphilus cavernicola]|uniref:Tat pathway signal sequence domain protein n=1 Tax=Streptacidiphilus cavernicola TaxID=3342716 RepID=A0ABV6VTQ7_9ACTN